MAFTVKEVSSLSSVSVRTLHYYDEIGILHPAAVGSNGYRYYEEEQLLRLQQIMFFREFGISLADIGRILDDKAFDAIQMLEAHRVRLTEEATKIAKLLQTLDRTMMKLKGERDMSQHEMFEGFDLEKQRAYEQEVKERWGDDHPLVKESLKRTENWTKHEFDEARRRMDDVHRRMKLVFLSGAPADGPEMQQLIGEHYQNICQFYTPSKEVFIGLGQVYVDDPRFRKNYDALLEGLAEYVRDAMHAYAQRELE